MTSHDVDTRFSGRERRSRVANLYLPLVAVCIDNLNKLYAWLSDGESRIAGINPNDHNSHILKEISGHLSSVSVQCCLYSICWVQEKPEEMLFLLY